MTNNIDIETLADSILEKIHPYDNWVGSVNDLKQFAEAYAAKVLEEKEREITRLTFISTTLKDNIDELQAHINDLRETLQSASNYVDKNSVLGKLIATILSKTPAQSLQEHDNNVIEKVETILIGIDETENESSDGWWETSSGAKFGAEKLQAIRTLKVSND